jgi:tRNA-dihydrouridine synthase
MKLRIGYDSSRESRENFIRIVSDASERNVDALTIHGRTVMQRFTGDVDWDLLAETKRRFGETTIIGSGDLFEPQTIARRLMASKVDGVLVARGAVGNPWIYKCLNAVLKGEPAPRPPSLSEQAEVILRHFEAICRLYEPAPAIRYFRKFLTQYCRLHPRRRQVRKTLMAASGKPQFLAAMEECYGSGNMRN